MARTKERWIAYYAGGAFLDGRTVVAPIRLANQPDRLVELRLPASQVERFLKGIITAAETEPQDWLEDQVQADLESAGGGEVEDEDEEPEPASVPTQTASPRSDLTRYLRRAEAINGRHARI